MAGPIINSGILKIAGRCNINCTYCYMYNLADQSYKEQPTVMARSTIEAVFRWVECYLNETGLDNFHFSLHGGEPLLVGKPHMAFIADQRDAAQRRTGKKISLSLLTNGLLLDEEWVELFRSRGIKFGMSLDGPREYHDRYRLTKAGEGTHAKVEEKLRWVLSMPKGLQAFSSVLCVLHPEMDGRKLLNYFVDLGLEGMDFLLPDQNHLYGSTAYPPPQSYPTYGRVLADAYRAWRELDNPGFRVRKFAMIIAAMFGKTPSLDSLGTGPITVFTIETSGEIEPVDTLKACGHGFTKSGRNIRDIRPLDVNEVPLIRMGLRKRETLPAKCRSCRHQNMCGGGYLPHRYSADGFERETVYCVDMMYLCDTIREDISSQLAAARGQINSSAPAPIS